MIINTITQIGDKTTNAAQDQMCETWQDFARLCARLCLKQMWRLTKEKTEMKSEHWTIREN